MGLPRIPRYIWVPSAIGTFGGMVVIFKEYVNGARYKPNFRIPAKTIIVTGANRGIGKETAQQLAQMGGKVILACRDPESKEAKTARFEIMDETHNRNVHLKKLDLASMASIREFANDINQNEPRVNVLINNAGIMRCPKKVTQDGFEMQLGVNHLGHFLLTNLLLDKLKASSPSRIVTISSVAHERGDINFDDLNSGKHYDPATAYCQSKLANAMFAIELSKRLKGTGVTSNAVHPGLVNTDLGRHMRVANSWLAWPFMGFFRFMFFKTPIHGAATSVYCAVDPALESVTGKYFSNCAQSKFAEAAQNEDDSRRLWLISERWTRLDDTTPSSQSHTSTTKPQPDDKATKS